MRKKKMKIEEMRSEIIETLKSADEKVLARVYAVSYTHLRAHET